MPKKNFSDHIRGRIISVIILLGILWFFRPWFHELVMVFYKNPVFLELFALMAIIIFFWHRKQPEKDWTSAVYQGQMFIMIFSLLIMIFVFGGMFASIVTPLHIVNEMDYNKINELPETRENVRLMPYEVAYRYGKDSLQLSQFKLGTGNIALIDGTLSWMFPLIPDGAIIEFILKNKGIAYVDATTQEKNSKMEWKDLEIGEGMLIFDNLWWGVYKNRYFIDLDDPYYIPYDDELYTVVSVVSYSFHNKFGLFYTVPRFAGVFLIDSNGNIEFLEPEEAKDNAVLKGNRIFPEELTRTYVKAYEYNNGVINRFFIHEDQIDLQDISYVNRQPFLMDTSAGLKWFVSTEPVGESHGIFKIFLVDAATGKIEMYELPLDKTLTGPIKAADFVRKSNPIVDWSRFKMVEPLPFIEDSLLYWKLVVVPYDAAGIAYQAFVNSETNDVVELKTSAEISKFIKEGAEPSVGEVAETKEETIGKIREKLTEIDELLEKIE